MASLFCKKFRFLRIQKKRMFTEHKTIMRENDKKEPPDFPMNGGSGG